VIHSVITPGQDPRLGGIINGCPGRDRTYDQVINPGSPGLYKETNGCPGRDRTYDQVINSHLLYH
jgi:hypothetical protein